MSTDRPTAGTMHRTTATGIDLTDRVDVVDRREEESIGELVAATARDIGELMRKEVELAKTELREEAAATAKAGALLAVGGLVGYLALLIVLLGIAWALGEVIPLWVSLLLVGIVAGVVAAVLVNTGKKRLSEIEAAPITIETIQEDVQWARQQMS